MKSATASLLLAALVLGACHATAPVKPSVKAADLELGRPRMLQVFQCGEDRLVVASWDEQSLTVKGAEYSGVMGKVESEEGLRFVDGTAELRLKDGTATFTLDGITQSACASLNHEIAWESAKLAGVAFRAFGRGWSLENGYKEGLLLQQDGQADKRWPYQKPEEDTLTGKSSFEVENAIHVEIDPKPCSDEASATAFESTVEVTLGETVLNGCGKAIR